jgi:small conductance mechanosensitive channel
VVVEWIHSENIMRLPFLQIPLPDIPADTVNMTRAEEIKALKNMSLDDLMSRLVNDVVEFAIHLAIAIFVFYVGKFVIKKLFQVVATILYNRGVEKSLSSFVLSLVRILLYFILIVTVIGILGINTSSFVAIFASVGVAIGMALSGTLQNFAGGVLILLLRPYKVGDYIETQGFAGKVVEIQIFSTVLCTADNKTILLPNGALSTGSINNWSKQDYRRVQWSIGISYGDDFNTAKAAILDIIKAHPLVLHKEVDPVAASQPEVEGNAAESSSESAQEPEQEHGGWLSRIRHKSKERKAALRAKKEEALKALESQPIAPPAVYIAELADSSVNLTVRAWARTDDYWTVYYDVIERIYAELPQRGVSFPFPQMDVHLVRS